MAKNRLHKFLFEEMFNNKLYFEMENEKHVIYRNDPGIR